MKINPSKVFMFSFCIISIACLIAGLIQLNNGLMAARWLLAASAAALAALISGTWQKFVLTDDQRISYSSKKTFCRICKKETTTYINSRPGPLPYEVFSCSECNEVKGINNGCF